MEQNQDVNIPDGDVLEDAKAPAKKALLSPGMKFGILIVGAMVAIGGGLFYTSVTQQAQRSQVPGAAALDSTPGGEVQQGSPVYQEAVSRMNDNRSEKAAELGVTSVPTPEAIMTEVEKTPEIKPVDIEPEAEARITPEEPAAAKVSERRTLPRPPAPPVAQQPAKAETASTAGRAGAGEKEKKNPYAERIVGQMGVIALEFNPKPMADMSFDTRDEEDPALADASGSSAQASSGVDGPGEMVLRPGDLLYGETLTSVNSDNESPVMVEVTTGAFKGARLVGKFTANRQSARMQVEFDNMTAVDGEVYQINAIAVDGRTAETAVASDVERRYVARYAPILAATFITGYAQSAAQAGSTVTGSGDDQQVVTDSASTRQSVMSGVAAATSAIAEDIIQSAPKGPKIILTDGYPIAIMVIDPVLADGAAQASATEPAAAQDVPGIAEIEN